MSSNFIGVWMVLGIIVNLKSKLRPKNKGKTLKELKEELLQAMEDVYELVKVIMRDKVAYRVTIGFVGIVVLGNYLFNVVPKVYLLLNEFPKQLQIMSVIYIALIIISMKHVTVTLFTDSEEDMPKVLKFVAFALDLGINVGALWVMYI